MTTPTLAEALRLALDYIEGKVQEERAYTGRIADDTKRAVDACRRALFAHDAQPAPGAAVQAMPADTRLLPCPKCGSTNVHCQEQGDRGRWFAVECFNEHCTDIGDTEAEAIANWNTRLVVPLGRIPAPTPAAQPPAANPIVQAAQRDELLIQLNGMIDVAERFARHMHKRGDTDERDVIQRAINAARASIEGAAKP
jgi:hypothetical protein